MNNFEMVKLAESYLGKGGAVFRSWAGLGFGAPWCNAFVSYIFAKSGNAGLYCNGAKETYCPHSIKWCYADLAVLPIYLVMPGDIVYFDWQPNGTPDHVGIVRERISDLKVSTIEGNTSGSRVARKERTEKEVQNVFRPHFKPTGWSPDKPLEVDGYFGYNSISVMQKWLGVTIDAILGQQTVKVLQKKLGLKQDGWWGPKTSKALQKLIGTAQDGYFGPKSVKALQTYLNAHAGIKKAEDTVRTNAGKLAAKAIELAYAGSPDSAKYPSGKPKDAYRAALDKYYPDRSKWGKAPRAGASCDVFVGTCIRACGIDPSFPRGLAEQQPYLSKSGKFTCVVNVTGRSVKESELRDGDVITYNYKQGGGHICIYAGGKLRHASIEKWYGRTTGIGDRMKISDKKFIRVYRAK